MRPLILAIFTLIFLNFFPVVASGAGCDFRITANDMLQFDLKEIHVPKECVAMTVTIVAGGKAPSNLKT